MCAADMSAAAALRHGVRGRRSLGVDCPPSTATLALSEVERGSGSGSPQRQHASAVNDAAVEQATSLLANARAAQQQQELERLSTEPHTHHLLG